MASGMATPSSASKGRAAGLLQKSVQRAAASANRLSGVRFADPVRSVEEDSDPEDA
jgi:hypothetical protein